mgnify:CR=1 FL=1
MAKKNHDSNIGLVGAILVIGGIGILVSKIKEYPFYFVMGAAGIIALASGCWYLYLTFKSIKMDFYCFLCCFAFCWYRFVYGTN